MDLIITIVLYTNLNKILLKKVIPNKNIIRNNIDNN